MNAVNWKEIKEIKMTTFPYRGEYLPVVNVTIRWLSNVGLDESGTAEYGLRYFTVGKGGQIPIHKHFYAQTMYLLSGEYEVTSYKEEDDAISEVKRVSAGDSVFIPSMEPHSINNVGGTDGSFLCCICNVYKDEEAL